MNRLTFVSSIALAGVAVASAQSITPDLTSINDPAVWRTYNREAALVEDVGRNVVRLNTGNGDGVAWLVEPNFATGTIEVDLRGQNKPGQSFVGIAFHGVDDATFEAIYFRPFNFEQKEPERRSHSVQYISMPEHDWSELRDKHPGKYENAIDPTPKAEAWLHARIVIDAKQVHVFANGANEPCLVVERIPDRTTGSVGLWVGNGSDGSFADMTITPGPTKP